MSEIMVLLTLASLCLTFSIIRFASLVAKNKEALQETPLLGDENVICNYPKDEIKLLGYLLADVLVIGALVSASIAEATLGATLSFLFRKNTHRDMETKCPTAKTCLTGGAGFMYLEIFLLGYIALTLIQDRMSNLFQFDEEFENDQEEFENDEEFESLYDDYVIVDH